MKRIKNLVATTLLIVICLFSAAFVHAQNRTDSKIAKAQLSLIKGKQRIFVDIANEKTKRQVEDFFSKNTKFEVTANLKDAEIVYASALQKESRPSFGTVENRSALPLLPSGERSKNDAQFHSNQYDYRRKTSALAYFDEPNGTRVILWSKETLQIIESKESGAILEFSRKSGDELSLAKQFVKAVEKLK